MERWKENGIEKYIYYYYDESGVCGMRYVDGTKKDDYHYLKNIFGDILGIYSTSGECLCKYVYDAWGNHKIVDENDTEITDKNNIAMINPFRYRGYYFDTEFSLYYLQNRYYDPQLGRFLQACDVSELNLYSIYGLNLYSYANNNPIGITYSSSSNSRLVGAGKVNSLKLCGANYLTRSNGLSIKLPSQNWVSLGIDFTASMAGAFSVLGWIMKNPEFYEFCYTAYGISINEILNNLKSPMTKIASAISYCLVAYDTYTDVTNHINAGDSWQTAIASGIVTAGVGAFNVWSSTKIGASIGTAIGGPYGFIIGTATGIVVGIIINGIFYMEINGNSIAGHIEDSIEWFLELIS